jgi:threonine dehydratase
MQDRGEAAATALPGQAGIAAARELLAQHLPRTRLVQATAPAGCVMRLHLKLEHELPTGSFKVRGALVALHAALAQGSVTGVTAASTGNHGAAVAWAARVMGVPATIFLPDNPNSVKRARILEHGARVVEAGPDITAARAAAEEFAADHDAFLLDDATDPHLPAGPGTIGAEIMDELPAVGTIVVPVGDTALIRGVAAAAKGVRADVRIIGVQAATAPAYADAWRSGRAEPTERCDTIADGLATRVPDPANVAAIRQVVDDVVTVTDTDILAAMRHLLITAQIHAEPSAAAAVAALPLLAAADDDVVAIITGCNSPPHVLAMLVAGRHAG